MDFWTRRTESTDDRPQTTANHSITMMRNYGLWAVDCRPRLCGSERSEWRVVIDAPQPAADQMSCDEALALAAEPAVRLYRWDPPAVSLGLKHAGAPWGRAA